MLLEAFHFRFQPSWQYFLTLVDRPNLESVEAVGCFGFVFSKDDIRFRYELGGGTMLDLGTYQMAVLRQVFGTEPEECLECVPVLCDPPHELCDAGASGTFRFPGDLHGTFKCHLKCGLTEIQMPRATVQHKAVAVPDDSLPSTQEKLRRRRLVFHNFMVSGFLHSIIIEDEFTIRNKADGKVVKQWKTSETKRIYTWADAGRADLPSEPYWLSYRHMLEGFVNRIRGRQGSGVWVEHEDSIAQAKMIDMAYIKGGLPLRPKSTFVLET